MPATVRARRARSDIIRRQILRPFPGVCWRASASRSREWRALPMRLLRTRTAWLVGRGWRGVHPAPISSISWFPITSRLLYPLERAPPCDRWRHMSEQRISNPRLTTFGAVPESMRPSLRILPKHGDVSPTSPTLRFGWSFVSGAPTSTPTAANPTTLHARNACCSWSLAAGGRVSTDLEPYRPNGLPRDQSAWAGLELKP